jgi:putative peptidoglycan lipid II flippase
LLFVNLRRRDIYQPQPGWTKFFLQLTAANLAMGLVLGFGAGDWASWITASASERLWRLSGWIAAGGASYLLTALAVGIRPRHLLHG